MAALLAIPKARLPGALERPSDLSIQENEMSTEHPQPRLLPLIAQSENERLANGLARLLTDDVGEAENASRLSIVILTGIQLFLDSGSYSATENTWEAVVLARDLFKEHGPDAWKVAAARAGAAKAANEPRQALIYTTVAEMLAPDINKKVDENGGQSTVN